MMRRLTRFLCCMLSVCFLTGCTVRERMNRMDFSTQWRKPAVKPEIPEKLEQNSQGIPMLDVYDISEEKLEKMDIEEYVTGVVAGEMKNDWPLEALKAQAILARTFVLKFVDTKNSRYENAHISTDVEEAQAYAPENINDRVRRAIEETSGVVMSADGEYPHAWFFAHAGGMTELPDAALDFKDENPAYLSAVESPDSDKAPEDVKNWTVGFTLDEIEDACQSAGLKIDRIESIKAGEKGESGRLKTLLVNGQSVSAPTFRIAVGANKLKSTLIHSIELKEDRVVFSGSGFGHGVGMSQWGAYAMVEEGKSAEEIIHHYFNGVDLVKIW